MSGLCLVGVDGPLLRGSAVAIVNAPRGIGAKRKDPHVHRIRDTFGLHDSDHSDRLNKKPI